MAVVGQAVKKFITPQKDRASKSTKLDLIVNQLDLFYILKTFLLSVHINFNFSSLGVPSAGPSGRAFFGRSPAETVLSNPTEGLDVCLL
jgi:hypothetical protein